MLLRVNSSGNNDLTHVQDWAFDPGMVDETFSMVTNADQGVVLLWQSVLGGAGMAVTTGTSVSIVAAPTVAGQSPGTAITNILQAQDGSFVGAFYSGPQPPFNPPNNMVAFDASGNVRWVVPNDQPQIATDDGGVIGQSGIIYDQNGSATGQGPVLTQSWTGNLYQDGPVQQVAFTPAIYAFSYAAAQGGNPSGSNTNVQPQYTPQRGLERLAHTNLTATPTCNALLAQFATMGHVSEATLVAQLQATANRARSFAYDGPISSTPLGGPLGPIKFPGAASPGVTTVGEWFGARSVMGNYAEGFSQFNGDAVWVRLNEWTSWTSRNLSVHFLTSSGHLNSYAMGTLMHEILHKQTVGGGFSHPQMDAAINAVGWPPPVQNENDDSVGIGKLCFGNLQ